MNYLLAFNWGEVGVKAAQFILSFSILIVLHEFGHYITAKWFKCRVEKFYLFFNPWFSLWKKKKGETEYGLGWIPLGGYVKISGMIDESMDKEAMKQPAQPYEFRSKPAWQRLIIMLGGIIVNVILAIFIFIFIMWIWGEKYIPQANLKYGIYADSLATKIGLQDGDKLVAIDGDTIEKAGTFGLEIASREAKTIQIDRDGQPLTIAIPPGFVKQLYKNKFGGFSYMRYPLIVDSILPKTKIRGAIQKGDQLIRFNDIAVTYNTDILKKLDKFKDSTANLVFLRNGTDTVTAEVYYDKKARDFIGYRSPEDIFGTKHIKYSFFEAIPAGYKKCWSTLGRYINGIRQIFSGKVNPNDSVGSVFSIGNIYSATWDWQSFWTWTAVFSIILAFMNILPIPGLDGGHALFTLVEMITGRKPSEKFLEYAQIVGMVLLFGLMAYALGLDIFRMFK